MMDGRQEVLDNIKEETVLTINGTKADAYLCNDGVWLTNLEFENEEEYQEIVVPYEAFIQEVKENNGCFNV